MSFLLQISEPIQSHQSTSQGHETIVTNFSDDVSEQIGELEYPLSLATALHLGLLDADTGLFCVLDTSTKLTLRAAMRDQLIDGLSATYTPSKDAKELSLEAALETNLLSDVGAQKTRSLRRLIIDKQVRLLQPDPKSLYSALDTATDTWLDAGEAVRTGLISISMDSFRDTANNSKLTIQQAINAGLVKQTPPALRHRVLEQPPPSSKFYSVTSAIDLATGDSLSAGRAIEASIIDQANAEYVSRRGDSGKYVKLKVSQAIEQGLMDGKLVSRGDARTTKPHYGFTTENYEVTGVLDYEGNVVSLQQACTDSLMDCERGCYVDSNGVEVPIMKAIRAGKIIANSSIVKQNSSNATSPRIDITTTRHTVFTLHSIMDPTTGMWLNANEAIEQGLIDVHRGVYIHPKRVEISLSEAIESGDVRVSPGYVPDDVDDEGDSRYSSNESLHIDDSTPADVAESEELVEKTETFEITGVIDSTYEPDGEDGDFHIAGDVVDYAVALEKGLIDHSRGVYLSRDDGEIPIAQALSKGFIMGRLVTRRQERSVFRSDGTDVAGNRVVSVLNPHTTLEISPAQAVRLGLLTTDRMWYIHKDGTKMDLPEAIRRGFVNPSSYDVSKLTPSLPKKITQTAPKVTPKRRERAVINWADGTVTDCDGILVDRHTAFNRGLITEDLLSLLGRKAEMFMNKDSEKSVDNTTNEREEKIISDQACEVKVIHLNGVGAQLPSSDKVCMLVQATSVVTHYPESVVIEEMLDTGDQDSDTHVSRGLSLLVAIQLGLYNLTTQRYYHPITGQRFTLLEAVVRRLIDDSLPAFKCTRTGRTISSRDLVDLSPVVGSELMSQSTLEKHHGICVDVNSMQRKCKPMNLLDAVAVGLLNAHTGEMIAPLTDGTMTSPLTISEAIQGGHLHSESTLVYDVSVDQWMILKSAIERRVIHGDTGAFLHPEDVTLPPLFSLADAIASRLVDNRYDSISQTVWCMENTGDQHQRIKKSLKEVLGTRQLKGIDSGLVYQPRTGLHTTYRRALESGLMTSNGNYIIPRDIDSPHGSTSTTLSFAVAVDRKLVLPDGTALVAYRGSASPLVKQAVVTCLRVHRYQRLNDHVKQSRLNCKPFGGAIVVPEVTTVVPENVAVNSATTTTTTTTTTEFDQQIPIEVPQVTTQVDYKTMLDILRSQQPTTATTETTENITDTQVDQTTIEPDSHITTSEIHLQPTQTEPESFEQYTVETTTTNSTNVATNDTTDADFQRPDEYKSKHVFTHNLSPSEQPSSKVNEVEVNNEPIVYESSVNHNITPRQVEINWKSGEVIDPSTGVILTPWEALQRGLIDVRTALLIKRTRFTSTITTSSSQQGRDAQSDLPADLQLPMTLNAANRHGLLVAELAQVEHPITGERFTVERGLNCGVLDGQRSIVIDPCGANDYTTLTEAIDSGLMDPTDCSIFNNDNRTYLNTVEVVLRDLIPTYGVPRRRSVSEATREGSLKNGVYSTKGGYSFPLHKALERCYLYEDPANTIYEVAENGLFSIKYIYIKEMSLPILMKKHCGL